MKKILLPLSGILFLAALASCSQIPTESQYIASAKKVSADEVAANISVTNITPGSNKLVLENKNEGIGGTWDYNVGTSTLKKLEAVVPFMGEQTIKFYATCDTEVILVEKKVTVSKIEFSSDPLWTRVAGESIEGVDWKWNTSMGCYGAGGYGYSPLYPDWSSNSVGINEYNGQEVFAEEYFHLDLNLAANVVLYNHDGTTSKGSFSVSSDIDPEKAEAGWVGTITFKGAMPPCPFTYYGGSPVTDTYYIAKLTSDEMVLIQGDRDQGFIWKDPAWSSASTHWCFIRK